MAVNNHITELTWFDARRYVPDSVREVIVLIRHCVCGSRFEYHITEGQYFTKQGQWRIDSRRFNPNRDLVTQWAEKDVKRGAIAIPEPFPSEQPPVTSIANMAIFKPQPGLS